MGGAAEITYTGDAFSGEISGLIYKHDNSATAPLFLSDGDDGGTGWQVGAGAGFALGGMANLSAAASIGDEPSKGDYWNASVLLNVSMTDSSHIEVGASYADYNDVDTQIWEAIAGVYYEPVSQLTLGLEADWADGLSDFIGFNDPVVADDGDDDFLTFDFVAIWRF
jgi:hypothetical protein